MSPHEYSHSPEPTTSVANPYLGLGLLASIFGLVLLFTDSPNFGFKAGMAMGQIFASGILALPLFLVWRFGSVGGRASGMGKAFNAYCFTLLAIWFFFFVIAKNFLPSFIAGYEAGRLSVPQR